MSKRSLIKKILILVLILALPGFLYYLLTVKGKNRYHPLAKFGPKTIAKTGHSVHGRFIPDTIFHIVPDFKLTDENGNPVSFKNFEGKIVVAGFFYTHCPSVCTTIMANMDSLAEASAKSKLVSFISVTVDPARDTPPALKDYAKKFTAPKDKWLFLTGDTTSIYLFARQGLLVNALKVDKDNFIYSDQLILLDSHRRIRGYYAGASATEVQRLSDEIKVLITEELLNKEEPLY